MIEMYEEDVSGIQIIHAVPSGKYNHMLPTIFFYHGFLSSKEIYSYFAYTLAKAGFRVVLPDAQLHGARADGNETHRLANFWHILQNNVEELALLKDVFTRRGLADEKRLGVGGVSMGGMTTMASLVRFPWIKVAANLMGSGYFSTLSERLFPAFDVDGSFQRQSFQRQNFEREISPLLSCDILGKTACLAGRPLFVWHGEQDEVVPFNESVQLAQEAEKYGNHQNLTFFSEPQATHKVTVKALAETTTFFSRYL